MVKDIEELERELYEKESEARALEDTLADNKASRLTNLVTNRGHSRGEIDNIILKQYQELTGKQTISPGSVTPDGKHAYWEYALDDTASELGYKSGDELKEAIEAADIDKSRIEELKHDADILRDEIKSKITEGVDKMTTRITVESTILPPQKTIADVTEVDGLDITAKRQFSYWTVTLDGKTYAVRYAKDAKAMVSAAAQDHRETILGKLRTMDAPVIHRKAHRRIVHHKSNRPVVNRIKGFR